MHTHRLDYLAARLCSASYPREVHRLQNMLLYHDHIRGYEHGADVFVGEGRDYNWVVFRGTEVGDAVCWKDVWTDIKFSLRPVPGNPYRLHRGFFEAWREVAERVTEMTSTLWYKQEWERKVAEEENPDAVPPVKPWVFTGHSLGAAMALVAAASLHPAHCVTFGGPRVGGKKFVEYYDQFGPKSTRRYVNKSDWCPRLPPPVFGHRHVAGLRYFDQQHRLWEAPPRDLMVKDFIGDFFNKWKRHSVDEYVANLEGRVNELG